MTRFHIEIDRSLCSGFGACAELAPEVFVLEGGLAELRVGATDDASVREAAAACPMGAIRVVEEQAA